MDKLLAVHLMTSHLPISHAKEVINFKEVVVLQYAKVEHIFLLQSVSAGNSLIQVIICVLECNFYI